MDDVLAEVRVARRRAACVEVEFLGQTVNAYRDAAGPDARRPAASPPPRVDGIARLRFTTSHPAQMTDR